MEISYRREMKHNYLIIEPDTWQQEGYEMRMLVSNSIEGLLKFRWKQADKLRYYYYEITSKQPLSRILAARSITAEEIRQLIFSIAQTLNRMESYLLKEEQILLDPDYIYVEPGAYEIFLCLVPGRRCNFPEAFGLLLQYILKKVDHQDKECVVLAYGLFQESQKENYGMEDLLKLLRADAASPAGTADGHISEPSGVNSELDQNEGDRPEIGNHRWQDNDESGSIHEKRQAMNKPILRKKNIKQIAVNAVWGIIGPPAAAWMFLGESGVWDYWILILAADIVLTAALILFTMYHKADDLQEKEDLGVSHSSKNDSKSDNKKSNKKDGYSKQEESNLWEIEFNEDTEAEIADNRQDPVMPEAGGDTVLLTDLDIKQNVHKLQAAEKDLKDIMIPYYPFIIGKQETMADYVLMRDTVSRLHLRIDREGEVFLLTDLNSTNGTMAGGRLLEANETIAIQPGDEIMIADAKFLFQ